MVSQRGWQHTFQFLSKKPIVVEPVEAQLTSDAGLLPIRQFDEAIGLTQRFANASRGSPPPFVDAAWFFGDAAVAGVRDPRGLRGPERPRPARPVPLAAGILPFRLRRVTSTVPMEPPAAAPQRSGVRADCRPVSGRGRSGQPADVVSL